MESQAEEAARLKYDVHGKWPRERVGLLEFNLGCSYIIVDINFIRFQYFYLPIYK